MTLLWSLAIGLIAGIFGYWLGCFRTETRHIKELGESVRRDEERRSQWR